jgi:hypothetical protein
VAERGRRTVLLVGLCLVVLVVAVTAALYARSAHDGATIGSGRDAPTMAQAQKLLDRQAAAVLDRNRASFLAGIDTAGPAKAFRTRQAASFDNLADVPLASWKYTVAVAVDAQDTATVAQKYGVPTTVLRVSFSYALRYVDPAPADYQLYLSFVRTDGQVRLAGDDDLAAAAGQSWHGPWDYGPIQVYRGRNSLILAHPGHADLERQIAAVVDASVPAVSAVWGTSWTQQVAVIVPDTQAEMNEVIDSTLPLSQIAATTYVDTVDSSTHQALGVRVAVNLANIERLDAVGLRITLQHEVTLVATWATRSAAMPTWVSEGFAEYVANLGTGQSIPFAASELAAEVTAGTLPAALPTSVDFSSDSTRLPQVYEEAWLACRLIAERAGASGLVSFFRLVGASTQTPDQAVESALEATLSLTTAQFTASWQQYLIGVLA